MTVFDTIKTKLHHGAKPGEIEHNNAYCEQALYPKADIRATKLAYHIEVDAPGIANKNQVMVQWLSPLSLFVSGTCERPDIGHMRPAEGDAAWLDEDHLDAHDAEPHVQVSASRLVTFKHWLMICQEVVAKKTDLSEWEEPTANIYESHNGGNGHLIAHETAEQKADAPTFILQERCVGGWGRKFTLPRDAAMKGLRFKLEAGLLRIDVPRRREMTPDDRSTKGGESMSADY